MDCPLNMLRCNQSERSLRWQTRMTSLQNLTEPVRDARHHGGKLVPTSLDHLAQCVTTLLICKANTGLVIDVGVSVGVVAIHGMESFGYPLVEAQSHSRAVVALQQTIDFQSIPKVNSSM